MIYVIAYFENGYCGCDQTDFYTFVDDTTTSEINDQMYDAMCAYAESYSHVAFGWDEPYTDEEWDDYLENQCSVNWEVVSKERWDEERKEWGL